MMLDSVELDDQFEWVDEFTWDAVAQEQERSVAGVLLVQEGIKLHGRPITLQSNGGVWTPLSVVRQLEVLRDQRLRVMPLTLPDGRSFSVIFNRADGAPLEATQLFRTVNPGPDEPYEVTLRLITVAPPPANP
ncbi:hypothetical protein [Pseudomonas panipatensis]|uniref:Uncharacterized protein n=1 Tax=Pseudomonas panipatensis TaxID=428992 RepID=A0A1G8CX85_9PSED|nr:hypothetical protein [Pseudomonas panipatensis]SDH49590.1 hypothetical protein SAMN05216272_101796 [Pseudomonas panipatensis]SMP63322.1 hypothetical protein SAMN06295951_10646 [Pseudomonas panipatensis]